jgi:SAM-dependent MidA family methyltransferase
VTPLAQELLALIAAEGPMPVDRYMAACLGHPRHGYYMTRDPFGAAGDFVTAPELSQIFGELLGLWAVATWQQMGSPGRVVLAELGPGRGTLMADALRAARLVPDFVAAAEVHLVETSPVLRLAHDETLHRTGLRITWHDAVSDLPDGPAIILANEFLDALPLRQFVRSARGWHERLVGSHGQGGLAFGLAPEPDPRFAGFGPAPEGTVAEWPEAALELTAQLATRLARDGGAWLAIDYGSLTSGTGDTLQAVKRHAFVDPLAEPGEADLTVHVDFARIARRAAQAGALVSGPITQGAFLAALGLRERASALGTRATPAQGTAIAAAVERLAGTGPKAMGELIKVIGVGHPAQGILPGFPPAG